MSSLKALIKQHNERSGAMIQPICLFVYDEDRGGKEKSSDGGASEMMPDFKERWTKEMSYISDVPELTRGSTRIWEAHLLSYRCKTAREQQRKTTIPGDKYGEEVLGDEKKPTKEDILVNLAFPEQKIQRISLTGFPAQSVGSSNTDVLDSPCLLVLITGTSQSRQYCKSESDS
ncbi:hypothetical protein Tco_0623158 [Tanacetum coccineum]